MISKYTHDEFIDLGANEGSFRSIISTHEVALALRHGGMIAGGVCRSILLGKTLTEIKADRSDIDIFFRDQELFSRYMLDNTISSKNVKPSMSNFCFEFYCNVSPFDALSDTLIREQKKILQTLQESVLKTTMKIQIIKNLFNEHVDTILNFDFTNVRVGITENVVYIDDDWFDVEKEKKIDIKTCNSPLLGNRIKKYIDTRGLEGLTERSREAVTEWVIRGINDKWDGNPFNMSEAAKKEFNAVFKKGSATGGLRSCMHDDRILSSDDLIYLINKFIRNVKMSYDFLGSRTYKRVDLALEEIKKRKDEVSKGKEQTSKSTQW